MLQQALIIFRWVCDSEVPQVKETVQIGHTDSIHDTPQELLAWEKSLKSDMTRIESTLKLSPTNVHLNEFIKNSTQNFYKSPSRASTLQ